jgi:hypothetical protein
MLSLQLSSVSLVGTQLAHGVAVAQSSSPQSIVPSQSLSTLS